MAYFNYQDKSVFYEEYGQGEPLIFLHGNTASSKMSELLMPLYEENFRCILIDFLGNGQLRTALMDVLLMRIFPPIFYLKGKWQKKIYSQDSFTNGARAQTGKR